MKQYILIKIFTLATILILGGLAVGKICNLINNVHIKQDKILNQVNELHVADGHVAGGYVIPYKRFAGKFTATFYCPCEICVGKQKQIRTSTGHIPHAKRTIAVDASIIPLHSIVYIKGLGFFVAEDTGSAIKGKRIDVYVDSHAEALRLGKKQVEVYILQ